jgi:hypothetical protein
MMDAIGIGVVMATTTATNATIPNTVVVISNRGGGGGGRNDRNDRNDRNGGGGGKFKKKRY